MWKCSPVVQFAVLYLLDYVIHPLNFTLAGLESENKKLRNPDDANSDDNDDRDGDEDE